MKKQYINLVWATLRASLLNNHIASSRELNNAIALNLQGDFTPVEFSNNILTEIHQQIIQLIKPIKYSKMKLPY